MPAKGRFLTALLVASALVVRGTAAFAQATEVPPEPEGGFCSPWHYCLAAATLGGALLLVLALFVGYMIQRRGFDKIEHRQGNPEGVEAQQ